MSQKPSDDCSEDEITESIADDIDAVLFNDDTPPSASEMSTIDSADREQITMEVTMDVHDLDNRAVTVLEKLAAMYEQAFIEVVEKNRDYGFSFLKTGAKLSQSGGTPFETASRSQAYGLLTRTGDKRERLIENVFGDGDAAVSDDPATTAQESANYYMFLAFVLDNPELASSFGQPAPQSPASNLTDS